MKLNLGCGQRKLEGYLNVDITTTNGVTPDLICDIGKLTIEDSVADEVISVHVIEHIDRSKVLGYLKEWKRVLKDDGLMIVECPNLLEACRELVKNPHLAGIGGSAQRTMWPIYGDPSWPDPLGVMRHKWGYTPDSLKELLVEAGLRNPRQEPARFRLKEPRDMRVVAQK